MRFMYDTLHDMILDNQDDANKIITVDIDGKIFYLDGQYYIEANDWFWQITENQTNAITVEDFVFWVEEEANDDCWDSDIRYSRLDSCINGAMLIVENLADINCNIYTVIDFDKNTIIILEK